MRLYARALKAKHKPKYSLGIICQWIGGLVNSPLFARSAYGSFALCSKDESGTASRTKPFTGNSWRYFSELCSVLDTTFIGAMHRIGGGDFIYWKARQMQKKYLQSNAAKIAEAFAEGEDDIALSKFVSLGLMDAEALLHILPIVQEKGLPTSIAYLLEEMRKYSLRLPDALEI